jgi:glycine cleavage system H protein
MAMAEYRFSEAHTWAKKDGEEVLIGITEFAANELGDIIFVELPDVGATIAVDDPMGSVESAKTVEDIIAPLSGEVTRVNDEVIDAPELLNEDPYAGGWLLAIKASEAAELDSLLDPDQYSSLIEEEDEAEEVEEEDNLFESEE